MNDVFDHGEPAVPAPDAGPTDTTASGEVAGAPGADATAVTDEPVTDEGTRTGGEPAEPEPPALDLDAIARDLDGVEAALRRLDDGTYWTDEITGDAIPDDVLATDPVARRAG